MESGDLKEDGNRLVLDGQLDTITIPATLHDSLMARLDRLQPIKEVAQIAACIGREFGHGLLVKISGLSEADLGKALDGLIEAGLIYRRGLPPAASYSFKHALVRDTAYESLLKERRKGVHTKIFESLRSEVDVMPEILAFHAEAANLISTAADLRFEAGKAAIAKPAFDEAIAHLNKARSLLLRQPISPERNAKDLEICLTLGPALMATRGLAAREAEEIYQAARALSYSVCDDAQSFQAAWGLWLIFQQRGQIDLALNSTKEVMELAGRQEENIDYALQAYHAAWTTDLFVGNISKSFEQAVKGENLYDIKNHRGHAFSYGGHDPGVCAKTTKSEALCLLGHVEQAVLSADEAIEIAKRINHPFSLAMALYFMAQVHQYRREPELVQKHALLAIELCEEHGFESFRAQSAVLFGWATSSLGKSALGIMKIREGLAAWQSTGTGMRRPYFLGLLADSLLTAGKIEQGLEVIAEAENLIKQTRETRWLAETLRLKGVLMDNLGSSADEVLAVFNQALEIAEQQEARLLGLRVASSCGAFLHKNGKTTNARRMISQHCEWFDDKDNVPDLAEAKALLAEWANV